jgi:hypothetical protein
MGMSNQPPGVEPLEPMLELMIANTAQAPKTFLADAGYWNEGSAKACEKHRVDPHIEIGRQPHSKSPPPISGPIPKEMDAKGKMVRNLRFLVRGLEKVNSEWTIWGITHNLNKLLRYLKQQKCQEAMATG